MAQRKARTTTRRPLLLLAAVVAAIVSVGAVLFAVQGGSSSEPDGLAVGDFPEPGVVHVHGLGIDPADGALYAATHSGLFRLPASGRGAQRVANRYQDTMGFTVTGPRTFLGSGHPDAREDDLRPPLLGLIESTDAGNRWQSLSLRGKADFHALHAAHGQVYGYNATSGSLMVSADRKRWESRSRLPMRDFAVSPVDAEALLATTEQGLARSGDGGRTWAGVPDAPALSVVTWATAATIFGAGPDGSVYRSQDGGTSWVRRGATGGDAEAIAVDSRADVPTLYVAASGRGVLASTDGGTTFTTRYAE